MEEVEAWNVLNTVIRGVRYTPMGDISGVNLEFGWSLIQGKPNSEIVMELMVTASDAFDASRAQSDVPTED